MNPQVVQESIVGDISELVVTWIVGMDIWEDQLARERLFETIGVNLARTATTAGLRLAENRNQLWGVTFDRATCTAKVVVRHSVVEDNL